MLETLDKLFGEQLKLSPDYWAILLTVVVAVAFFVTLLVGLLGGNYKKIKSLMKASVHNPSVVVAQMKKMPTSVKTLYKNARIANIKPSSVVTQQVCVEQPYKHSLVSKIWLVTFVTTVICAALAFVLMPIAPVDAKNAAAAAMSMSQFSATALILILGGLLTLIGAIVGKVSHGGACKVYDKFVPVLDGDSSDREQPQTHETYSEQHDNYTQAQATEYSAEAQQVYAEPQQEYVEPQNVYAEQPQNVYAEPMQNDDFGTAQPYAEPVTVSNQESDEEIRRRAREEALAQMRAQQAQQQQAQQAQPTQPQTPPQAAQAQPAGNSSVDDVIAKIEQIDREGAPRETMREVATLLQKERAKPENKTPEQQRRLNEALSKLLKAMSAATKR